MEAVHVAACISLFRVCVGPLVHKIAVRAAPSCASLPCAQINGLAYD